MIYLIARQVPDAVSLLKTLTRLELANCGLTDLPLTFDLLTALQEIDLSQNQFHELPKVLLSLKQLTHLHMSAQNSPHLQVTNLKHWPELRILSLASNKLEHLPELPDLLVSLDFSNNRLTDVSPLVDCIQLETVLLSWNLLEDIPTLFQADHLRLLACDHNKLSDWPDLPPSLLDLRLAHNRLPSIPPTVSQLSRLEVLDIGHNALNDWLPSTLGFMSSLKSLKLEGNSLQSLPFDSSAASLHEIQDYLRDLAQAKIAWDQLKISFVGEEGAGKVCHFLTVDIAHPPTHH
jgi:Leucine-rich repeat (LRR) protein